MDMKRLGERSGAQKDNVIRTALYGGMATIKGWKDTEKRQMKGHLITVDHRPRALPNLDVYQIGAIVYSHSSGTHAHPQPGKAVRLHATCDALWRREPPE